MFRPVTREEHTMNTKNLIPALALAAVSIQPAQAADPAPVVAAMPKNAQEWVAYLSDFTRNGEMLADPKKFVAALSNVTEPAFMAGALEAAMDPNLYARSAASAMDPKAYGNYARIADPAVLTAWAQALLDPQFVNAVLYVMTDPGKLMRWGMVPMDPKVTAAALNLLNPNQYARWLTAPMDPRIVNLAITPMNPGWYGAWGNNLVNPNSYAPMIGGWVQQIPQTHPVR